MCTATVYLHHHGELIYTDGLKYVGGRIEEIKDVDLDLFSFIELDKYAEKFMYSPDTLVHYLSDGHSFRGGIKLIYDDEDIKELVKVCKDYGRIDLYVDHQFESDSPKGISEGVNESESDDEDDPAYQSESASDSEMESLVPEHEIESDDELDSIKVNCKKFKEQLSNAMNTAPDMPSDESASEDMFRSLSSSSEDENAKIGYRGPPNQGKKRGKKKIRGKSVQFEVGQKFGSMEEFKKEVRKYAVNERRGLQFVTNDKRRCQVMCQEDCPFYIWCSRNKSGDFCTVKTLCDTHQCTKPYSNKKATVKFLEEVYGDRIRSNPQWKYKDMAETLKNELEIEIPRVKIARLRKAALEGIVDSLKLHYSRVRDFGQEILLCNPGNTVKIATTRLNNQDPPMFKRIYVCYYALKAGWKAGCRPVIGLDGCFLKTVCGGQLLSAIGRDGNNQMYPICYAVVESEITDSWKWFIEQMQDDLDLKDGRNLTIISDQQKGLQNALLHLLPEAETRLCTRHLCANFTKRFTSKTLKSCFWNITSATYKVAHGRFMKELERISKPAHAQLSALDVKQWCKSYFATHACCDDSHNNLSESFNSWIINERYMPLLTMLQGIHLKLMTRVRQKRDDMMNSDHILCPKIKKLLDRRVGEARKWNANWDGNRKFQVRCNNRALTVNLEERTCDCRVYDLTGIPCEHAIAAIISRRHNPMDYVSGYYKREMYLEAYKHSIEAMKGEEFWDYHGGEEILPPPIPKKLRGRPKKLRAREHWEGGSRCQSSQVKGAVVKRFTNKRVMHCSVCGVEGHKKTTCPSKKPVQEEPPQGEQVQEEPPQGEQVQEEPLQSEPVQEALVKPVKKSKIICGSESKKSARERRREKLPIRRPKEKGIFIKEPSSQLSQSSSVKKPNKNTVNTKDKGKRKLGEVYEHELDEMTLGDLREAGYLFETEATEESEDFTEMTFDAEEAPEVRRSSRLRAKRQFKFKNTPDTPLTLE